MATRNTVTNKKTGSVTKNTVSGGKITSSTTVNSGSSSSSSSNKSSSSSSSSKSSGSSSSSSNKTTNAYGNTVVNPYTPPQRENRTTNTYTNTVTGEKYSFEAGSQGQSNFINSNWGSRADTNNDGYYDDNDYSILDARRADSNNQRFNTNYYDTNGNFNNNAFMDTIQNLYKQITGQPTYQSVSAPSQGLQSEAYTVVNGKAVPMSVGGISTQGLTPYQISEIQRKAAAGLTLDKPTDQKDQLYKYYQSLYNYTPVQRTENGILGVGQQADPRANLDWNMIQQVNNEIYKQKAISASGDKTANVKAAQLREQLRAMGVPEDYILPVNVGYDQAGAYVDQIEQAAQQWVNAPTTPYTQAMLQDWMQQQQDIMNPEADMYKQYQELAEEQAEKWYDEQRGALESLIKQLQTSQQSQLMGINNSIEDATSALEDSSFQQWLAARQSMADRGLAGSGLASEQDTRLLLDKQRNLAGIYRDAEQQQYNINNTTANSLADIQRQISGLSQSGKEQELFQSLFGEAQKNMTEQSKVYADMLKELLGYDMVPASKQAELSLEQWKTQQNNLMDKYKTDVNFQTEMINLGLKEREIEIAALKADRDYSVSMSQQMGYLVDVNGKMITDSKGQPIPTVDKQKLDETVRSNMVNESLDYANLQEKVRHNMAGEQYDYDKLTAQVTQWAQTNTLKAQDLNIKEQNLARLIEKDAATVAEMSQNAQTQQQKIQIDAIGKSLSSVDKEIQAIRKAGKDVPEELATQRNNLINQLNSVANSMSGFQLPMERGDQ